ncbi:phage distal tail protein [Streptomyces sp. LNU-CPARS28]|uniref:phage distal tail protein n=1 Tax=Streptomyces sp. LNU-CPARS28 TaxID=3137371 RepID=UPI0031356FBC
MAHEAKGVIVAAGDKVTRPGHVQFGDELLIGPGTPYRWRSLTGWEELPALDSGSVNRADGHGSYPGHLLAQARTITLDDMVVRAPGGTIGAVVRTLNAATAIAEDEQPLVVWLDERGPLLSFARVVRRAIPVGKGYALGTVTGAALQWEASDPRRYSLIEQQAETRLPMPEPGLDWRANDAEQQFAPQLATGQSPSSQWNVVQGGTLSDVGTTAMVTVTAASETTNAELGWKRPGGYGWPITEGARVGFQLDAPPRGARAALFWLTESGYLSKTLGARSVTGTAPAGATYVLPVTYWTAVPTPAAQPIGTGRMWMPPPEGEALVWPLNFGAPGSTGTVTAVNEGDAEAHPLITFRGPVALPSITNLSTGAVLEYDIELAADDELLVDTAAGTVTLNRTASRLYTATARSVPESTFTLAPGAAALSFRAAPGSTDPRAACSLRWRSAYW